MKNNLNGGLQENEKRDCHSYKDRAKAEGRLISDYQVMSGPADPFFAEQPASKKAAEWFAALYEERGWSDRQRTLRGIHYILRTTPSPLPSGEPYEYLKERHVTYLYDAAKYARVLGLVDIDMIIEEQNQPTIYVPEPRSLSLDVHNPSWFDDFELPEMPDTPNYDLSGYEASQRYLLELWAEKNTMNHLLKPLCATFGLVLQTGRGHASLSMVNRLIKRIKQYHKPAIILWVNDFDPFGMSMPVAVARHIEHYLYSRGLDPEDYPIAVQHIVLTPEQVHRYNLPVDLLKDDPTSKGEPGRNMSFKQRYGVQGSTELDALDALLPGEFERIIEQRILHYYDANLRDAVAHARWNTEMALKAKHAWVVDTHIRDLEALQQEHAEIVERVEEPIKAYKTHLNKLWRTIEVELEDAMPDLKDYPIPEGKEVALDDVLYSSQRDEDEQLQAYKAFQGKEERTNKRRAQVSDQLKTAKYKTKLTPEQKQEVRRLYEAGSTYEELAKLFPVSVATLHRIVTGA